MKRKFANPMKAFLEDSDSILYCQGKKFSRDSRQCFHRAMDLWLLGWICHTVSGTSPIHNLKESLMFFAGHMMLISLIWSCLQTQFNQTPTDSIPEPLNNISKDTPIMMYCTGGIRCDIYSPLLREKGFTNLYTLHGGVANYLREIGSENWKGSLFTFDNRLAIAPGLLSCSSPNQNLPSDSQICFASQSRTLPNVSQFVGHKTGYLLGKEKRTKS